MLTAPAFVCWRRAASRARKHGAQLLFCVTGCVADRAGCSELWCELYPALLSQRHTRDVCCWSVCITITTRRRTSPRVVRCSRHFWPLAIANLASTRLHGSRQCGSHEAVVFAHLFGPTTLPRSFPQKSIGEHRAHLACKPSSPILPRIFSSRPPARDGAGGDAKFHAQMKRRSGRLSYCSNGVHRRFFTA